jgi:ribulose-phosphate 3-epimerase
MQAGVAINPHTPVENLYEVLQDIDVVCMMSVNPGFGGQKFIAQTLDKIVRLKAEIQRRNLTTLIEIDGGVTLENASTIIAAGADVLVAGNTVFASANPMDTIAQLKRC